jgi:hypothetical protein
MAISEDFVEEDNEVSPMEELPPTNDTTLPTDSPEVEVTRFYAPQTLKLMLDY